MNITPEIVRELLHYDPETGIFTWRERGRHWFQSYRSYRSWNGKNTGKRAGYTHTDQSGYQCRCIQFLGNPTHEHRLAWLWMTDEPLPCQIDHENRIATDNRWSNLRAADFTTNARNASMNRTNTSGYAGVSWVKRLGKWKAYCGLDGKPRYLGVYSDINDAAQAVADFRAKHGFDPGHGKEVAHYHAS